MTRNHAHHYKGFLANQRKLFGKERTVKALLYCFRVALTGTHLLQTGELQAHLPALMSLGLADEFPYVGDLIAAKAAAGEHAALEGVVGSERVADDLDRLEAQLLNAADVSSPPEAPSCRQELDELLVAVRLNHHLL